MILFSDIDDRTQQIDEARCLRRRLEIVRLIAKAAREWMPMPLRCFVTSVVCTVSFGCATPRDYGTPLIGGERPSSLPVFVMDKKDADRHPIEAVFIGDKADRPGSIEITVVFKDESPSFFGIQTLFLSEPIRRLGYGRWQDVESLCYDYESGNVEGEIESVFFDGTFACCQPYRALWPLHSSATIPIGAFEREDTRPVIYVTTWNHLFHWSPRDLAKRNTCTNLNYDVYRGTRDNANNLW